jgi:hypothetical protein
MKTPKENQLKEDFFVQSTIIIDGYEVNDIPCKIYLPENPLTKPRLEFKPNHESWQQVSMFWRGAFKAKTFDYFGGPTAEITAPVVYFENMRETMWGPNLYDCSFSGEPNDLRVVQYLKDSANEGPPPNAQFSLWLSPNTMLQPTIVAKSHFTGNVEMERIDQLRMNLAPDLQLVFDTEYRHKTLPNGDRLEWSILVAYTDQKLSAEKVGEFNSTILPSVDDFLWIAGLGSRTRTACVGWAASDGKSYTRYFRGNLDFPTGTQRTSINYGLVSLADYKEFLASCWDRFSNHPGKASLKGCIQALLPNRRQTLEASFLSLFAGFEELLLDYRIRNRLEFIISENDVWNKISKAIRSMIKNFNNPKIEKRHRALFYSKLGEFNRVPLQYAFERFCSDLAIDLSDLWPVFPNSEGVGLSNIRNKLIHGERFPNSMINALAIARDHLEWVLERIVIGVLGWPVARTEVSPEFLSGGANSYRRFLEARKQISELLKERTR